MNITKSSKLIAVIITVIALAVFIMVPMHNRNKDFMRFISLGVTTGSLNTHLVYIKLLNEDNLNDTIDIIVPNYMLRDAIWVDTPDVIESDSKIFNKQFVKDLAYCIRTNKPMIVSANVFNEFNNKYYTFAIDKNIQREFNLNGYEHYIDEERCLKGYTWDPRDSIPNPPLNDSSDKRLKNLIYLLQKERIGVYSYHDDEAPDYHGYAVWRY